MCCHAKKQTNRQVYKKSNNQTYSAVRQIFVRKTDNTSKVRTATRRHLAKYNLYKCENSVNVNLELN